MSPARDGGLSGASLDRPALQALLAEVRARKVEVVVVYKVDRLTRSLADFAKLIELFDAHAVSFVSVTQSFNTTSSMGRLTLKELLPGPWTLLLADGVKDDGTHVPLYGPNPMGTAMFSDTGRFAAVGHAQRPQAVCFAG